MVHGTLLPSASTAWEKAVEEAGATFSPLPVPNATLWNPDTCPEHMLPWLAHNLSVDLWNPDWPVWRKRRACREALQLARIKGTLEGLRRYLEQVDAELVSAITPPAKMFLGRDLTKEDLDRFLSVMPQLRIYPNRVRLKHVPRKMFLGKGRGRGVGPGRYLHGSNAMTGRRTYLYDPLDGSEKLLTTFQQETREQTRSAIERTRVVEAGRKGNVFFLGGSTGFVGRALGRIAQASKAYMFEIDNSYVHAESSLRLSTLSPGLAPMSLRFERGTELWPVAPHKFYLGRHLGHGRYLRASEAWLHAFTMVRLHDPSRSPRLQRKAKWFLGRRMGVPAHTAHIRVRLNISRRKNTFFFGDHLGHGFLRAQDLSRRELALQAIEIAMTAHDDIYVSFQNHRPITLGDRIPLDGTQTFSTLIPRKPA